MNRWVAGVRGLACAGILAVAPGAPALAAGQPVGVAAFKDWTVFVRDIEGDKICFAGSEAKDKTPKSVRHGGVFFLIATWKSGVATQQPSLMTGYNLAEKPRPTIRVGSDKFEMYVSDNEAFIERNEEERRLIDAMKRGSDMQISAVSGRGTATAYTISLQGLSKALESAAEACR